MVGQGLTSEKQKEYLKKILQSQRVNLVDNSGKTQQSEDAMENVPRRIVKVKRMTSQQ